MLNLLQKFTPQFFLRLGLGAMFVYSGSDILLHPTGWIWAIRGLPVAFQNAINAVGVVNYLRVQGAGELLLAAAFLGWFLPFWTVRSAALLAAIEMAGILLFVGVDAQTFRDIGLFGAAMALWILPGNKTTGL